jgi:hypothetical protein
VDSFSLKTGSNAFLEACAGGDVGVVRFLVHTVPGKRKTVNCKSGVSALQLAVGANSISLVRFLLEGTLNESYVHVL